MKIYLFFYIFISSFLNINGSICSFENPNKNSVIDLEPILTTPPYNVLMGDVGGLKSYIYYDLCTNSPIPECNGIGVNVCQKLSSSEIFDLGYFYYANFSNNWMQITYKSTINVNATSTCADPSAYEKYKRVTEFKFICNKDVPDINLVYASESIVCYYQIQMEGKYFCDCENCEQPHYSCYNGKCQCDKYTTGENCEQLKINIFKVVSTSIYGGTGYLFGDFGSIVPNFEVFIGGQQCGYRRLIGQKKIEILVPPGSGNQSITITDEISSYHSPILFEYIFIPCQSDCSHPHGYCDILFGVCSCDSQTEGTNCEFLKIKIDSIISTTINGGVGYLNGDFQFITPNLNVFFGETLCTDVELVNASTIRILVPPDNGFKNVTITDGISSYFSPILFEYINVPCLYNCSQPHGECNFFFGVCTCDNQTIGDDCEFLNIKIHSIKSTKTNGGVGFINGDFQYIIPNFKVFIGEKLCKDVKLLNDTTIEISVPPGVGFKNVTITDGKSSYISPILFEYIIVPCLFNCSQPHGECDFLGVCTCDTQTNGTGCENSRIYIDSIDPTDGNGGTTYLYGYFGNTTSNLYIQIGESYCNNIQQTNETLIKCDIGVGSGFKDVLLQDRDLQVKVENLFQYFVPITTNEPKQCLNDCGGPNQGICLSSGCSCISPWIGNDCMSKIVIIPQPSTNYSNPITEIPLFESINNTNNEIENKLFISLISIIKLRELDFNSKELNSFPFKEWEFNKINSETSQFKTNFTNLGLTTNVTVTLQWFNKETDFEFSNQIIKMNPSSIKYTIEISEFKFSSKLNQLQLIMKASISVNKTNEVCSDKEFGETSNGDDSNYLKVQVDNHSLYGRFIKRALIDSTPRSIENVQLDSSMNIVDSASQSQSFIGISVPYFKKEIIIDPDFSILVGSPSNSVNSICSLNDLNGFSKTKISAIVICGFFGIVTISTIAIYSYYKKKHDRNVINEIRLKLTTKQVDILM
ncbi:hypothetical protein ACTFIZ_012757 [Dictyostelium cf. discoideum]